MRFRALRLILLFGAAAVASPVDQLADRSLAFERHWNLFIRHLAGCPDAGETTKETCTLVKWDDSAEFMAARRAAIPLFDLEDRK